MATLTGRTIRSTYDQLIQLEDSLFQDGFGTSSLNGSYRFTGSQFISGNLYINGTASIDYLVSSYESSSIIYSSGSTKFGDTLDDTHEFTGSVTVTGSAYSDNWSGSFSGSFFGLIDSASNAERAVTASQADNATTASHALTSSKLNTVNEESTATQQNVLFAENLNGTNEVRTDVAFRYLPNTETLTVTKVIGDLEGSASFAETASLLLGSVESASFAVTASLAISTSVVNVTSTSFAASGDGPFTGSFSGSFSTGSGFFQDIVISGSNMTGSFTGSLSGSGIFEDASGSFSGSFEGDGSNLTGVALPTGSYTGSFTGSMLVDDATGSFSGSFDGNGNLLYEDITVTVVNDGGNKYAFNGITAPNLSLQRPSLYRFDLSDSSNSGHPFAFRLPDDTSYTIGVTTVGSAGNAGAYVELDIDFNSSSSLKYYCTVHGNGMGNDIQVNDLFNLSASGSFSGSFEGDGTLLTGSYIVANSANNRVLTSVDSTNGNAEANLTFDGTTLTIAGNINTGQGITEVYLMNQNIRTSDDVSFASITETSAQKYKENIETLESGDSIYKLRPVTFDWKESGEKDYGLIAEEVNNHIPELVKKNEKGEAEGIKYSKLTSLLVKVVQEQQTEISKLKDRLDNLDI